MLEKSIFVVLIFAAIWDSNTVKAECCHSEALIHTCGVFKEPKELLHNLNVINVMKNECTSRVCKDGSILESGASFCGYGSCNIFGCNCDGGCRNNRLRTWEEGLKLLAARYRVSKDEHQKWLVQF